MFEVTDLVAQITSLEANVTTIGTALVAVAGVALVIRWLLGFIVN